jgi:hypothetical protein
MPTTLQTAAPQTFPMGPGQGTDNISGLPNNQAKALGAVGTAAVQYYDDLIPPIQLTAGASGVSGTGAVSFYVICGETASIGTGPWTNGIDPNSTADQSSKLAGMTALSPTLPMTVNASVCVYREFSIYAVLGFMPSFWSIVVYNQSGAALAITTGTPPNTNHIARHSLVSYV